MLPRSPVDYLVHSETLSHQKEVGELQGQSIAMVSIAITILVNNGIECRLKGGS